MSQAKNLPDIRMVEREKRRQGANRTTQPDLASFTDLAANASRASDEEVEKLRADLVAEREVRNVRIERFIKEGPLKPAPRAVVPVSENDL